MAALSESTSNIIRRQSIIILPRLDWRSTTPESTHTELHNASTGFPCFHCQYNDAKHLPRPTRGGSTMTYCSASSFITDDPLHISAQYPRLRWSVTVGPLQRHHSARQESYEVYTRTSEIHPKECPTESISQEKGSKCVMPRGASMRDAGSLIAG